MTARELGNEHLARGEFAEAVRHYRLATLQDPADVRGFVGLGYALSELGNLVEASEVLTKAVALDPAIADGHYLLGRIASTSGRRPDAIRHFEAALRCDPALEEAHRDLLRSLVEEDPQRASAIASEAVRRFPQAAEFWFYLGLALERIGSEAAAVAAYERSCSLQPNAHAAHMNAGRMLMRQQKYPESLAHYMRAAELVPQDPEVHIRIGIAQTKLGRTGAAVESYRRSLAIKPHVVVSHIVAALTGATPDRAPDEYVAQLFDDYAEMFDAHLVNVLKYNTPAQLAALLSETIKRPSDVLDLGCGTGLMGVELAGSAASMVGVDLSAKMLDKARERGLYTRLERADLVAMMEKEPAESYDLVIAADVFVYVGKLEPLYDQAFRLLRHSGLFAFSVEAAPESGGPPLDGRGYALHERQRYVHEKAYLERLGGSSGFELVEIRDAFCREDAGVPVRAYLALFRKPV